MVNWYKSLAPAKRWGVLAAALLVLTCGGWLGFKRYKDKKAAPEEGLAEAQSGDIEVKFSDSGELSPKNKVDVASKVSGRVIEFAVQEGARVKKGDTLAVIQPGRTEAERYVPVTVTSPIGGVVMRYQQDGQYQAESRMTKLGDYITGLLESNSPTYLLTVADLSTLLVKMKISEMDVLKLKEGMSVDVTIDALPGTPFPSKVTLLSPQAEKDQNNLKSFKVEVTLLKTDARLKPGMTARVEGLLDSKKSVVKLPLSAVFEEGGKEHAYLREGKDKHKKVTLKLGLRNETDAEVLEGVKAGDKCLTEKPKEEKKS